MKSILALTIIVTLATTALAFDLGNQAPAKPTSNTTPPPADPEILRQGGDTLADAVRVPIPSVGLTGTTAGYYDDYDEVCPYTGSTSPDVIYSVLPDADMGLNLDMFGSLYDTKIYVYDENLALIACNDDYYSDYTSFLENIPVIGGVEYFAVVDGYGGDFGEYLLDIVIHEPCVLECPAGSVLEDEPPLMNDYVDVHNGGCATESGGAMQPITDPLFCGVSGFYLANGGNSRDTDWFLIDIPPNGALEITGDAEEPCFMFELGPQDCNTVGVLQNVTIGKCAPASMTIIGEPGSTVWFWVGPTTFASPDGSDVFEFDYVLELNLDVVATENHSWTDVKALFD